MSLRSRDIGFPVGDNPRNEKCVSVVMELTTVLNRRTAGKKHIMRKSTRNLFSAASFLIILSTFGTSCSKTGSTLTTTPVTYLTLINEASYSGAVSVYLNDTLATTSGGIAAGTFSPRYGTIRPAIYDVKFEAATSGNLLSEIPASDYDTLNFYTLILYNTAGGASAQSVKVWDDFSTLSSINANYRFFNLSPDEPKVDLYLNNTIVSSNRTIADNASNTLYNAFGPTPAGTYAMTVKAAGTDSVITTLSQNVAMTNGNAYTIFLGGQIGSSANPLQINVLQATY
jgi:hypothetical protein